MDWLFNVADVLSRPYAEKMQKLVSKFNQATWPQELGLDKESYPFSIRRARKDKEAEIRMAPMKTRKRTEEKAKNDYKDHVYPASHVLDIVRLMVIFSDPYAMSVFAAFVPLELNIVRCKNTFLEERAEGDSQYRHMILNIHFEHAGYEQVVELQLTLSEFALARKWSHRPYKVERAETIEEIQGNDPRIFQPPRKESLPLGKPFKEHDMPFKD